MDVGEFVHEEGFESGGAVDSSSDNDDELSSSDDDQHRSGGYRGGRRGGRRGGATAGAGGTARRSRHAAAWQDSEIDVVVEDFTGAQGYQGPRLPRGFVHPVDVWQLFWPGGLLLSIVEQTNRYALQSSLMPRPPNYRQDRPWPPRYLQRWKPVTLRESRKLWHCKEV